MIDVIVGKDPSRACPSRAESPIRGLSSPAVSPSRSTEMKRATRAQVQPYSSQSGTAIISCDRISAA
jgi:hypothetical protein